MSKNLGKKDYVIIFAGTLNAVRGRSLSEYNIKTVLKDLQNTNVILVGAAFHKTRQILNKFIYEMNNTLFSIASSYDHINYVDANHILNNATSEIFYRNELKYIAKKLIFNDIYNKFVINEYINYSNLRVIETAKDFKLSLNTTLGEVNTGVNVTEERQESRRDSNEDTSTVSREVIFDLTETPDRKVVSAKNAKKSKKMDQEENFRNERLVQKTK